MKKYMIGAAAVLAIMLLKRSQNLRAAENQITEPAMSQSSDWQSDLWARLTGSDLVAPGAANALTGSAYAGPSTLDVARYWQ